MLTRAPTNNKIISNNSTSSHLNAVVALSSQSNVAFNEIDSAIIVVVQKHTDTRNILADVMTNDVVVRSGLDLEAGCA